jgi:hypothetical protein
MFNPSIRIDEFNLSARRYWLTCIFFGLSFVGSLLNIASTKAVVVLFTNDWPKTTQCVNSLVQSMSLPVGVGGVSEFPHSFVIALGFVYGGSFSLPDEYRMDTGTESSGSSPV